MTQSPSQCPTLQSLCEKYLLRTRPTQLLAFAVERQCTALACRALENLYLSKMKQSSGDSNLDQLISTYSETRHYGQLVTSKTGQIVTLRVTKGIPHLALVINQLAIPELRLEVRPKTILENFLPSLVACKKLHTLSLDIYQAKDLSGIAAVLPKTALHTLILDIRPQNNIQNKQPFAQLAKALAATKTLQNLTIEANCLKEPLFTSNLQCNTSIQHLYIKFWWKVTTHATDIQHLSSLLQKKTCPIKSLSLENVTIDNTGMERLGKSLKHRPLYSLQLLDCSIATIAPLTQCLKTIEILQLSNNPLNSVPTCKVLSGTLLCSHSLHTLKLSNTNLDDQGCIELSRGLKSNSHLTSLTLSNNKIGDPGCKALVATLPTNALVELDISDNQVTKKGISGLANILLPLKRAISIDLYDNIDPTNDDEFLYDDNLEKQLSDTEHFVRLGGDYGGNVCHGYGFD